MNTVYIDICTSFRVDLDCHTYRFVVYRDVDCTDIIYESPRYISKEECRKELHQYVKDKDYKMLVSGLCLDDEDGFEW